MAQLARIGLQPKLLLAFALVLLIPTVLISAYNQVRARATLVERLSEENLRLASARVDSAERLIAQATTDLLFAAQSPPIRRFERGLAITRTNIVPQFRSLLRYTSGRYSGLCLLTPTGDELVCVRGVGPDAQEVPTVALRNRANEPFFTNTLRRITRSDDGPVTIVTASDDNGDPLIRYATYLTDDEGSLVGVIVLEAPTQALLDLLADPDPRVATTVVDSDGLLLSRASGGDASGQPARLGELQPFDAATILYQESGAIVDSPDAPGQLQVFARLRPLGQTSLHWTVIYAQPIDGLLMDVRSTGLVTIAITLGALLIALLVAQLLAHSVVRPVRELAAAAERVGAGDLHTPIPAAGNDEIGALGRTLRHTVGRLRESLHLAEQGLQEAETLRAATRALSSTLARDEVLQLILSELQKVVPYDSASVQVLEGNSTTIIGTYGLAWHESIVGMRFALDDPKSPNGEVVRSRAPLILDDAPARFALFHSEPFSGDSIRSWLGVPMIFGAHVIGVITLDKREPGFYKADHARLAADFAAHAAIAMENARLYAAAQQELNERQRAEEELRQAQKMEALGRLAGGLAHDFNNLLTVILGETDMLLDDMARDHPDRPAVEQIRQSGARAAALTRQLLAFSRRQMLQAERVNLNDVIVGMEQLLRRLIGEDVSLTIALAHNLPDVRADRSQMEQVLMNLVINARDAMPEGGHLLIETTATTLTAEDARAHSEVVPGFYAMLAVTDTGSGMDETTRAHIFEPFFTTKPRGKGTGLGLATVHGIVRQSGGQIWFHSEPDRGSTFNICLPAVVDAIAEPVLPQLPEPTPRSAAAETVLLVEDDEHVRSLTRVLLLRAGFTVLEASDGPAALALVRSEPGSIALLLTDVIMPGGLNGVQLARAVRTLRPAIGVVYMSGYTDNAHVDQSLVEDGARYLQKPFTLDALVESVLAALAKGETGRV